MHVLCTPSAASCQREQAGVVIHMAAQKAQQESQRKQSTAGKSMQSVQSMSLSKHMYQVEAEMGKLAKRAKHACRNAHMQRQ